MPTFVDRLATIPCTVCASDVPVADAEPLSTVHCPACGAQVNVPGMVGMLVLTRVLGRGTTGIVYEAFDQQQNIPVAVKVFFKGKDKSRSDSDIDKCLAEANALRAVNSPNVVRIHRVAQKGERPFIVMELLTGDRLDRLIENHFLVEEDRALRMAIDITSGLKAVHDAGFAHLDVKPANIQMDGAGTCKLLDYDTARSLEQIELEGAGLVGTPYYVAPEIVRRQAVDFRADIFSLGATLFHLIAQRPPFQGSNAREVVQERLNKRAPNLHELRPDIGEATAAIIARMLAPEPGERYANYDALLSDLRQRYLAVTGRPAPQPGKPAGRAAAGASSAAAAKPSMSWAAVAALVILALVSLIWWFNRPAPKQEQNRDAAGEVDYLSHDAPRGSSRPPAQANPPVDPARPPVVVPPPTDPPPPVDPLQPAPLPPQPPVVPPPADPVKPPPPPTPAPTPVEPAPPAVVAGKEVAGWKAGPGVAMTHRGGPLNVFASADKPHLTVTMPPTPATEVAIIELRLRAGGDGAGRVSWTTAAAADFSLARSKELPLVHDNEWREYLVSFRIDGAAAQLRLELGTGPGLFEIDWIRYYISGKDGKATLAKDWKFSR